MRQLIIIGSGPSGLTAAIYASRARLEPLVFAGDLVGGQLTATTLVENYPGFPQGVQGPELISAMQQQAEHFGAVIKPQMVTDARWDSHPLRVKVGQEWHESRAMIVATGASPRYLGLPKESRFIGSGVSTCATCDGFFYRDREIAVVGGGDSAMEEALFLTRFARRITIIHRRDRFRASPIMAERVLRHPKISMAWNSVVADLLEDEQGRFRGVLIKEEASREKELAVSGVFLAIGHVPNTQFCRGQIELDEQGYAVAARGLETNRPGVFVAGDVCDRTYRQAITAAGMGCMAALQAQRYLDRER